ncbi:MAG: hypothetical protein ACRDJY_05885 [Thermoleophilaceae bacterium]
MRKLFIIGLALLLIPALALAGKTVTSGTTTLKVKTTFDPAKASKSKDSLRPTATDFDYFADTTDGSRLPDARSVVIFMGGARFGFNAFPKCDETDAFEQGDSVCPDGSLVGEGTGVAEVHGDPADPSKDSELALDVKLYNGALDTDKDGSPMDPRPGLLVYTELGDTKITLPFWGERKNRQVAFRGPYEDPDPGVVGLYEIKEIHLTIDRRSVRRNGKRTPFLGLPTQCDGHWVVTATNDPYEGDPVTAKHRIRCTEA